MNGVATKNANAAAAGGKSGAAAASSVAATGNAVIASPLPPPSSMTTTTTTTVMVSNVSPSFKSQSYENGLITACNNLTYDEVMRRRLVGLPRANLELVLKLRSKSSAIFLLNMESKELYGVFEADGAGGLDLEPEAWNNFSSSASAAGGGTSIGPSTSSSLRRSTTSRFPAQCKFTIAADFETPLQERHYRELLYSKEPQRKIRMLSGEEVKKLIKVFQAKSKLRKIPSQVPVQHHAATTALAAAAAAPSGVSLASNPLAANPALSHAASSSALAAAAAAATAGGSANNSRRNSIDSTASGGTSAAAASAAAESEDAKRNKVAKIQQTCKRWLADQCTHTAEECKYLHVPNVCRAFQRGTCPKGTKCPFIHDKNDRENYKHGRAYCLKTAVHPEEERKEAAAKAALKEKTEKAAAASKSKPTQQKDSLDSILSGLGSWKIAKKAEPEPEMEMNTNTAAGVEGEEDMAEGGSTNNNVPAASTTMSGAAASSVSALGGGLMSSLPSHPSATTLLDSDEAAAAEDAAALEAYDAASDAGVTFEHQPSLHHHHAHQPHHQLLHHHHHLNHPAGQLFMDSGLTFDMPSALNRNAAAPPSAASGVGSSSWSQFDNDAVYHPGANAAAAAAASSATASSSSSSVAAPSAGHGSLDEEGGTFFAPPSSFGSSVSPPLVGGGSQGGASSSSGSGGAGGAGGGAGGGDAAVEEFSWWNNFRTHIVQPAINNMLQREQQTQQKIIGPD